MTRGPVRVGELLLPTMVTLAGRGPVSAKNFLTLLKFPAPTQAESPLAAGTRVTAEATAAPTPGTPHPRRAITPSTQAVNP